MGRNRRQQRLRDRRSASPGGTAPAGARSGGSGGRPPSPPKPAWRETLDSFGGFTVVGGIVAAVLVVALLVFLNRPGASSNDEAFVPREHAQVNGRVMGDPNAPVKIVSYADFQCPFCHRFWDETEPLLIEEYVATGKASFEYRDYVIIGAESQNAAEGAACAADQNRFWDFHDLLFLRQGNENSGVYSDSNMKKYAGQLKETFPDFDVDAWEDCYDSGAKQAQVDEGTQQAIAQGLQSTPSFIINGQALVGAQPIAQFRSVIDALLANAPAPSATPASTTAATATATP